MKLISKIILVLPETMQPTPNDITILADYGSECLVSKDSNGTNINIVGDCMYLQGTEEAFRKRLSPLDGFWTTNNPMIGEWKVQHIKA